MRDSLPESIDPEQQANRPEPLSGVWPAGRCRRLGGEGRRVLADVVLEAAFTRHGTGRIDIDGRLTASVELTCQRCLQPMRWSLEDALHLAVQGDRAPAPDDAEREVIELDEQGRIFTGQWLEDEVLLRMPMVPRHAELSECDPQMLRRAQEVDRDELAADDGDNPFSVLKDYF